MRRIPFQKVSICIAALTLWALSTTACAESPVKANAPEASPRAVAVRTTHISERDVRVGLAYVGTVRSRYDVMVSAKTAGTLLTHEVVEGQFVDSGDVVATLSTPEMKAKLRSVKAEVGRVSAQARQACRIADDDEKLVASGVLPRSRADASRAACEAAEQGLNAANAQRAEVDLALAFAEVSTDAAGQVMKWLAQPGEAARPGQPLLMLGAGERELEVVVSDRDLARGIVPQGKVVLSTQDGITYDTVVDRIAPMASGPARQVAIRLRLPEELRELQPGAAVDASFMLHEQVGATPVPRRALRQSGGDEAMMFWVIEGRAVAKTVTTSLSEGEWVIVVPAPPRGTQIITSNLSMLSDGELVFAVEESGDRWLEEKGGQP